MYIAKAQNNAIAQCVTNGEDGKCTEDERGQTQTKNMEKAMNERKTTVFSSFFVFVLPRQQHA